MDADENSASYRQFKKLFLRIRKLTDEQALAVVKSLSKEKRKNLLRGYLFSNHQEYLDIPSTVTDFAASAGYVKLFEYCLANNGFTYSNEYYNLYTFAEHSDNKWQIIKMIDDSGMDIPPTSGLEWSNFYNGYRYV